MTGNGKPFDVVGRTQERREARGHVTGSTTYIDDVSFPRMCHMKAVRSPLPHARVRGIDFSEAEKVPGYVAHLTAADVPKNVYTILCLIGVEPDEEKVLADDRVRYVGEPIAVVVCDTEAAAFEAAAKVKLDLEELEAVFDVEEALEPEAPIVTHWGTNYFVYEGHHCRRVRYGDAPAAREQADRVISSRYQLSPIEHAPVEPTGCVAKPEADGRVTVHTNTQAIFFSLDNTAIILQVPPHKLRFVGGTVGGGFGGKVDVIVEPLATLAAMKTGRPIKYVYTREEEMRVSSTRSASRIYITDGVNDDGTIVSREVTTYHDAGAYSRHSPYGCTKHAANAAGPYTIPNVAVDVHCVYTNRVPSSAMRGFGVTEASFALEMQMDRIARELGADPWELRLRQAYRNGDDRPYRKTTEDATLVETIQAAAELAGVELSAELREMSSDDREGVSR
ncbi:MAG TPA: molybdopterin cofactor-binding domain-containing protein [Solirubrobacterales bacterium]|nr:molybdopterin cofactor-binding domain-containing protein [Solirubrobacterales bacterium]